MKFRPPRLDATRASLYHLLGRDATGVGAAGEEQVGRPGISQKLVASAAAERLVAAP